MSGSRRAIAPMIGGIAVVALSVGSPRPLLVWNATPSAPVGLYAVGRAGDLRPGDRVLVRMPASLARWMAARGYVSGDVPLIKTVAAVPGQIVCRRDVQFAVGHRIVAVLRRDDRSGRPMPAWRGCRRLRDGEIVLLGEGPDSLDSRYFGPFPEESVLGRVMLLGGRQR